MASTSASTQRLLLDKIVLLASDSNIDVALVAVDVLIDSADYGVPDWNPFLSALNSPHEEVKSKIIHTLESSYGGLPDTQKNEFVSSLLNLAKNKPPNLALSVTDVLVAIAKKHRQYDILLRLLNSPYKSVVQKAYASLVEAWEDQEAVRAVKEYNTPDDNVKRLLHEIKILHEIKTAYNKAYYQSAVSRVLEIVLTIPFSTFQILYFISPVIIIVVAVFLYWKSCLCSSSSPINPSSGLIGVLLQCFIPILTAASMLILGTSNDDEFKSKAIKFSVITLLWVILYLLSGL
jgi:hypothetical protein